MYNRSASTFANKFNYFTTFSAVLRGHEEINFGFHRSPFGKLFFHWLFVLYNENVQKFLIFGNFNSTDPFTIFFLEKLFPQACITVKNFSLC